MSSIVAKLKSLFSRPQPANANDAATQVAAELETSPGHSLVLGVSGSGKSVFLAQLATRQNGCRVVLGLTGEEPPGWEEAPFWGTLRTPTGGLEDWDLEDVLCQRPEGQFDLLVPFVHAKRVKRALSHLLATCAGKGAAIRPLWLTVDEPTGLVEVPTLSDVMRLARKDNLRVTLAIQSLSGLGIMAATDMQHLCVLRASTRDVAALTAMTGLPCEELASQPPGRCTYIRGGLQRHLVVQAPTS